MSEKVCTFAADFKRPRSVASELEIEDFERSPGGGMVDAVDSKSAVSNGVRVQVPPGVQEDFASNSK